MKLLNLPNLAQIPWTPAPGLLARWCRAQVLILLGLLLFAVSFQVAHAHNTVTKTTSTPTVAIGGIATYTFKADAVGTTTSVVGSQLTDILPTGLTYLSTTSVTLLNTNATRTAVVDPVVGATTPTWGTFTNVLAGGGVAAGAEQVVFNAIVGPTTACGAQTNNVLQTAGNVHTNTNALNTASINITGSGVANLVVTKVTTTPSLQAGGVAGYTITVTNTAAVGSCPATGVTISDALPTGFTYAATGAIALNGGTVRTTNVVIGASTFTVTPVTTTPAVGAAAPVWGNFVIPAGGSISLPFTANVGAAQAAGTYSNSASTSTTAAGATVTNFNGATSTADDVVIFVPTFPIVTKSFSPASVVVGQTAQIIFKIDNSAATTLARSGIQFRDTLTAPLTIANPPVPTSVNCGVPTYTAANGTAPFTASTITVAAGSICTITLTVNVGASGTRSNTTANISNLLGGLVNGVTPQNLTVTNPAAPTITKSFNPSPVAAGMTTVLSFTLTNTNPVPINAVAFTDTYPVINAATKIINTATPAAAFTAASTAAGCTGTLAAAANGASFALTAGFIPANTGCNINVNVVATANGTYNNVTTAVTTINNGVTSTGLAASSTLLVQPTLPPSIAKSFSPTTVPAGSPSTLTLIITNPNALALTNLAFTDTFPPNLVVASIPNINSSCAGTFTPAAGAINVNLVGGTVAANNTCTVRVDVTSTVIGNYDNYSNGVSSTESGAAGALSNTVTLTVIPAGVPLSGFVYSDVNHNIQKDGSESGTGLTLYAKLVPAAGSPAIQAVAVNPITGTYQFPTVTPGQYSIVIDDNASLADVIPTIPAAWIGTEMSNFTRANVLVSMTALQNLNFGLFNGSKLGGTVFGDTGITGGTANNGIKDGGELGIAGVTLKASSGATIYDSAITDGAGNYTLWIPASAISPVLVNETNPVGYLSTGGSAGTTAGIYTRSVDSTSFTFTAGLSYSNINFADVPVNIFAANGQQAGLPGNVLFYPHQFDAGSGGAVMFSAVSANSWPTIVYRDLNCNGVIDITDTLAIAATVMANERICLINKVTIPAGIALGLQDSTTLQAAFTYTNAGPVLVATLSVIDTTTVGAGPAGMVLTKTADKATALPGDTITYTVAYQNNGDAPIGTIVISDTTPAFTTFVSAGCSLPLAAALTACSVSTQPAVGGQGGLQWTLIGVLNPASTGQVVFAVKVN